MTLIYLTLFLADYFGKNIWVKERKLQIIKFSFSNDDFSIQKAN